MATGPALEVLGLIKALGDRRVLDAVRFELRPGEIGVLLGPNGSGKTTLLKTLATLVLPDEGTARIAGADIVREPGEARRRAGFHSGEERSFYGRLTARDNLKFFAALYGVTGERFGDRLADMSLRLGLTAFLDKPYQQLSTGMKSRLLLARALVHDAPVLLLDEPTRGLDPVTAEQMIDGLLVPLARKDGKAVLMATHHLGEAERVADEVVLMRDGKSIAVRREKLGEALSAPTMLDWLKGNSSPEENA